MLHFLRRDPAAAREAALQLTALASDNALAYRLAQSRILLGWTDPDPARGVQQIEESLTAVERSGARVFLPYYYGVLAETYLRAGLGGEALAAADRGLDSAAATGEIAFSPELHRLRAAAKLELGEIAGARADLTRSIDIALNQQADSLLLRSRVAALPLCSAADRGDQQAALAALLTSLEGRGHDTDLLAAAALLGSGSGARSGSR
jgi:predicted ATPase